MTAINIHQYLHYSQHPQPNEPGVYCALIWDLREAPTGAARHVAKLETPLTTRRLSEPATYPPVTSLSITCEFLPEAFRTIEISNTNYISLLDVLQAIYTNLHTPLESSVWSEMTRKHQARTREAFERRCRLSLEPDLCVAQGKLRVDCLAKHTIFGGLSRSLENEYAAIMSVRIPPP